MTQSDSPDFEFDISDLEVEREKDAPSKEGSSASREDDEPMEAKSEQAPDGDAVKEDPRADFDESDRELDVFEIDDLPSSEKPSVTPQPEGVSEKENGDAPDAVAEDVQPVQKIEPEPKPSRVLGDDDLGADVFSEMDSDLGGMGLDDVIDDLMEEVEDYEAGGFVDLDEEENATASSESDDFFKMSDPDDSLRNSVDPDAEGEDQVNESPAFPSPPADYEIPADPEPSERKPPESTVPEGATSDAQSPDFEIPADPQPEVEPAAKSSAQASAPVSEPPAAENPAPAEEAEPVAESEETAELPPEPDMQQEPIVEPDLESEPIDSPEPDMQQDSSPAEEPEDLGREEPAAPAKGNEQVFFSADEPDPGSDVFAEGIEEPDPSDRAEPVGEVNAGVAEPESLGSDESGKEGSESQPEEITPNEPEAEVELDAETSSDPGGVSESELEEEEDLSALLDAIEEEDTDEESIEDSPEGAVEEEIAESSDLEPEIVADDEAGETAEASVAESADSDSDSEDEELSDLVASVVDEADEEDPAAEAPDTDDSLNPDDILEEEALSEEAVAEAAEDEDELIDLPSPEDLVADEPKNEGSEPDEASPAPAAPGLVEVEEEDVSSLIGEEGESFPAPEGVTEEDASDTSAAEEDEDELVELPVPEVPGLEEVPEEEAEAVSEDDPASESESPAAPTAEDLLMQAGGLLNGDSKKPAEGASDLLDEIEAEEDEEIVSLPSPDEVIANANAEQAGEAEDDDDEVVALPDPASLMTEDGEAVAVIDDEDEEDVPAPGNVADRGGDLPAAPPAPVEIIDEEPPEEDAQAAIPAEETEPEAEKAEGGEELEDPFDTEISLDDFNEGFAELDVEEGAEAGSDEDEISADENAEGEEAPKEVAAKVVEMPKPSLLWRVTHSMAVAAGLLLVGLAGVLAVWKQQIVEYYEGRDIDGSALLQEIEEIGTHALSKFDPRGLYRMQWVDSEVRRVSENEIRLHALVGAKLQENLYRPVLESRLQEEKGYDESQLLDTLGYARDHYPEEIGNFPERPWDRLYEISAKKEDVLPLKVTYALKRENEEADWKLSRIKVSGYKADLEWPEGEPKHAFGENAYDIDSLEFAQVYEDYTAAAQGYVARIDRMKAREEGGVLALKRENERQRERVKMALAEGTFFNGLAIMGEDATASRDVQLVITEVRDNGGFVKGVVKLSGEEENASKHFVGSLEFEKSMSGREQGYLSLRTVSIDAPTTAAAETPFFDANNVSRMRLRADGFRLEGDSRDLSFRLTRSL